MKNLPFPRFLLLAAACAVALAARAADETTNAIKFSDPSKPGTLKVILARGDVTVRGTKTGEVVVKSDAPAPRHARKDGLRVLTESASYSLSEHDNVVTLDASADGWAGTSVNLWISVPPNTNLVIGSSLGGNVTCSGLSGDVDIRSLQGAVHLEDVRGSALVETLNGGIDATIADVREGKALSFTSLNGPVVLHVPANAKANVRLRTQNGTIYTDFDEKALVTRVDSVAGQRRSTVALTPEMREAFRQAGQAAKIATEQAATAIREAAEAAREGVEGTRAGSNGEATMPPQPPRPKIPTIPTVTGGKLVTGALNGGGPEIDVATMNGDVTLRQLK